MRTSVAGSLGSPQLTRQKSGAPMASATEFRQYTPCRRSWAVILGLTEAATVPLATAATATTAAITLNLNEAFLVTDSLAEVAVVPPGLGVVIGHSPGGRGTSG